MIGHPIENLMATAMSNIQDMIDVNTIIGEPKEIKKDIVIIPVSKVSFGFAAGGSEFKGETVDEYTKKEKEEEIQYRLPFGGGSGAGVSINPIAFLVVQNESVKLLPINHSSAIDKLLDYIPDLIDKTNNILNTKMDTKKIKTEAILQRLKNKQSNIEKKNEKDEKIYEKFKDNINEKIDQKINNEIENENLQDE